jgi:thiol-disulfide isomerase/thioredoxin
MGTIQRVTTLLLVALTVAAGGLRAQEPKTTAPNPAFDEEMRKADTLAQQRKYEEALQSYKKAFGMTGKSSFEACAGMALAYRGLGAHKNVAEVCAEALKLAGDARQQAAIHSMRGAALVALADKPDDKRLAEAEREFLAAIEAREDFYAAHLNLGVTLLKMNRDEEGIKVLKHYAEVAPKGKDLDYALRIIEEPRRAREAYAPDFSFTSKDGEFITLDDLKGKTVVLDFWGTWCKPCLMATPDLLKLRKKYAEQPVVFVGIAVRDQEAEWAAYIEKNKMDWPQFLDTSRKIVTPFAVVSYPTYVIIDAEGIVRARKSGYSPSETQGWLDDEIKKSLKRRGPS